MVSVYTEVEKNGIKKMRIKSCWNSRSSAFEEGEMKFNENKNSSFYVAESTIREESF